MSLAHQLGGIAWKTPLLYLILLVLMRVTGKRQIGTFSTIDLVAFIMMSEAAIISIADPEIPLLVGVAPVIMLGILEWVFAYVSLKDHRVRALVEGEPSVLVAHGRIDQRKLRQLRYNLSDLMAEMRSCNVAALADVEFAVLETSGKLSIVPRAGARPLKGDDVQTLGVSGAKPGSTLPKPQLPATAVLDGQVDEDALARAGKDRAWLDAELRRLGHPPAQELLLAAVDAKGGLTSVHVREEPQGEPDQPERQSGQGGDGTQAGGGGQGG